MKTVTALHHMPVQSVNISKVLSVQFWNYEILPVVALGGLSDRYTAGIKVSFCSTLPANCLFYWNL